jgi:signal transduction histidine kinase
MIQLGSIRARLTAVAAATVGIAFAVGGWLWIWSVEHRMESGLRAQNVERATIEISMRAARPDRRADGPARRLHRAPFSDAHVVSFAPDREPESSRVDEEISEETRSWVSALTESAPYLQASRNLGARIESLRRELRDCKRSERADQGLSERRTARRNRRTANSERDEFADRRAGRRGRPGPPVELAACEALRQDAIEANIELARQESWPQRIVDDGEGGRRLQTLVLARVGEAEEPHALLVDSSLSAIDLTAAELLRSLILGGPMLLVLVSAVAWLLIGRSLRVVGEVQNEAEQIAFGTLDRRIEDRGGKDEISRLVKTLNRMLDRIAAGARRQREFIGDASHELKSPIAAMRTQLEVALAHTDADWARVGRATHEEVLRMQALVEDLMGLARIDELRPGALPFAEIDLDDVVREEGKRIEDVEVSLAQVAPVRMLANERALRRVVRNLLDNAIRYGAGRISIELAAHGEDAFLTIEDDGPGIPREDRERIFDRFTRLESSRSRDGGGSGLGLALAKGLIDAHGGDIRVEDGSHLGGACFAIRLPLEAP